MEKTKRNENKKGFTQPFWVQPLLRRAGFTLGEMITTVAIIGTIAAIAIPSYLRIKMNANQEMVRQQMRIVAEKMSEIIGKNGKYPDESQWPDNMNPSDPDETSLMGNLSAIDDMCYTKDRADYVVGESGSTYQFCTRPKLNACGKWAGSKKFCIHSNIEMSTLFAPGAVGEMTLNQSYENSFDFINIGIFGDSLMPAYESDPSKLTNWLMQSAYNFDFSNLSMAFYDGMWKNNGSYEGGTMTYVEGDDFGYERVPIRNYEVFSATLNQIIPSLWQQGLDVSVTRLGPEEVELYNQKIGSEADTSVRDVIKLGIRFIDETKRVDNLWQANQKYQEFCNDPNGTIYNTSTSCSPLINERG